ncbi:MAG: hypothetical protein L6422_06925 [Candidatus Marinimicrobia bacterium]|nr:hypothetical protein [Candidatus Neomarinimicrobiota bacterium]
MSVLFSLNGQVHGHYTAEFITRSLKMNLLKSHLLIHVDCTHMDYEFRKELFMASRDRLKDGEETRNLRRFLATKLSKSGSRLWEIEKRRKDSISVESSDANQLIRDFTKNLPINSELMKLLDQTFKLDLKDEKHIKKEKEKKKTKKKEEKQPFKPERFPSCFKLMLKNDGEKEITKIPLGGEKSIPFQTDAEDHYFDRIEEPGELKIALLDFKRNEVSGGNAPGKIERVQDVINVNKSGPKEGSIKLIMNPTQNAQTGDALKIKATLTAPGQDFEEVFWVKISEPKAPKEKTPKEEKIDESTLGLPEFVLVYREPHENAATWEEVENMSSHEFGWKTVMYPLVEGENLEKMFINMDSNVLKDFKSEYKHAGEDQLNLADRKYISSVYFHTLFLYTITRNRKYKIMQEKGDREEYVDLGSYLMDVFESYYSEFILNFGGVNELMEGLGY